MGQAIKVAFGFDLEGHANERDGFYSKSRCISAFSSEEGGAKTTIPQSCRVGQAHVGTHIEGLGTGLSAFNRIVRAAFINVAEAHLGIRMDDSFFPATDFGFGSAVVLGSLIAVLDNFARLTSRGSTCI